MTMPTICSCDARGFISERLMSRKKDKHDEESKVITVMCGVHSTTINATKEDTLHKKSTIVIIVDDDNTVGSINVAEKGISKLRKKV